MLELLLSRTCRIGRRYLGATTLRLLCLLNVACDEASWFAQLLNLTWGAGASVAAGIVLEKLKIESKPIQVSP